MFDQEVDFLITSIDRPEKLDNLLRSIKEQNYTNKIYIGLQSDDELNLDGLNAEVVKLPYDCGLSYARNQLVALSSAPFVLILEDDFVFTSKTEPELFLRVLKQHKKVGVIGGRVLDRGIPVPFEFNIKLENNEFKQVDDGDKYITLDGVTYKPTDCVMNFALMSRQMLEQIKWDNDLKLREHHDFYIKIKKSSWSVLFTPDVQIEHDKRRDSPEYNALKTRDEYLVKMMEKNNLKKIRYLRGQVRELKDGKIIKYRE